MEAQMEKRTRITLSWNYEKEEQWLNEMSEQGLHLTKAGAIRSTFTRDPSVRYTYGLDYQHGLKKAISFRNIFSCTRMRAGSMLLPLAPCGIIFAEYGCRESCRGFIRMWDL